MKNSHSVRDSEQTKVNILGVALKEFATFGLAGARVDRIADAMHTTKGMIYYYFGNKEGLYKAVLEKVYPTLRSEERRLSLDTLPPVEAIETLIDFTMDYHERHNDFVRLVMIENINHAQYLHKTGIDSTISYSIFAALNDIVDRGLKSGVFKRNAYPVDLHIFYTSFCFYRISNHATTNVVLGLNTLNSDNKARHRRLLKDIILSYLCNPPLDRASG